MRHHRTDTLKSKPVAVFPLDLLDKIEIILRQLSDKYVGQINARICVHRLFLEVLSLETAARPYLNVLSTSSSGLNQVFTVSGQWM